MAPYSMDLRTRVLRDGDAGMPAEDVAAKYLVSRACEPSRNCGTRSARPGSGEAHVHK